MEELLSQIDQAINWNLYYVALSAALTVPDICGALDSPDGVATGERYRDWYYEHILGPLREEHIQRLTGSGLDEATLRAGKEAEDRSHAADIYRFRCSMLHQGRTQHPAQPFTRIIFIEPGPQQRGRVHRVILQSKNERALALDIPTFCREITKHTRSWLTTVKGTPIIEANLQRFVRRYPNGLPPYIGNTPVIS